ncbi:MAG: enoyl-CoA hydratase/isomerase family protein [Nanoarchaeota archaeon]|nr:enoyl-CoA hydratase/isomerase family protein [Nanoarchaeota archaeon]
MTGKIIFRSKGSIGTIVLNNPKKLNAIDFDMVKELDNVLEKIKNSNLKVVIIKGVGKSFCSGGDISWEKSIGSLNVKEAKKQMKFVQSVFSKIGTIGQIFIAVVHGHAIGGGNELAMACDIRIALPSAKFTHPETSLGTVAPLGGTKRLPRLIGLGRAKYMLFTGNTINSKTALKWGLMDFLVSENNIDSFLNSLVSKISRKPKKALELTKKSVNENYIKDFTDDLEIESYVQCSKSAENKKILNKFLNKK